MLEYIVLGIIIAIILFIILLYTGFLTKDDYRWENHVLHNNINNLKGDFIYILSELCKHEKMCLKSKTNLINGYLTVIDDAFFLYYPLDNGKIIRYLLPLNYWDIFDVNISNVNIDAICRTIDLREEE